MQPHTSPSAAKSKQPSAPSHAAGQGMLELADEDSDPADKPPNPSLALSHRSSSTQTVKPTAPRMDRSPSKDKVPTTSSTSNGGGATAIRRMFRSSSSSASVPGEKSKLQPFTQTTADSAATSTITAPADNSSTTTPVLNKSQPSSGKGLPQPQPPSRSRSESSPSTAPTPGAMARSHSTSVSPTSTLPSAPSDNSDGNTTPVSRPPSLAPSSRPSSRRSSFTGKDRHGASESGASASGGSKFTLKDLLANGPKLARKPSQSSRKSDASSDHEGGARSTTSLLKKYGVCEKIAIGKGATSVVRLAHKWDRSEEKLYAVKEFRKRRKNETEKEYVKKLTAEFCISSTLHHVNIVETVDLVQDEAHHWCEVMEYCPGGDLYAAIKKGQMSASESECCFKQLLVGVQYLHSQGVAHRDIKPENLFFDTRGHLKIGDYGASTVYRLPWEATVHMSTGLCGSEPYIAPEQFLRKPYDARLVDIWAVGIVYYCLLFQELPWRVAQPSDPLFATYAQACAASPFKPLPFTAPSAPSSSSSSASSTSSTSSSVSSTPTATSSASSFSSENTTPTATSTSHANAFAALTFPKTIQIIEPREARPLLRRILEPDPKKRASIEEIMGYEWTRKIEVCTDVVPPNKPRHGHANIRLALGQAVSVVPGAAE